MSSRPSRTEITSPSALKTELPDDPPVVIPSNWIRSAVTRDRIPAVIDVRTMEVRSRAVRDSPATNLPPRVGADLLTIFFFKDRPPPHLPLLSPPRALPT